MTGSWWWVSRGRRGRGPTLPGDDSDEKRKNDVTCQQGVLNPYHDEDASLHVDDTRIT